MFEVSLDEAGKIVKGSATYYPGVGPELDHQKQLQVASQEAPRSVFPGAKISQHGWALEFKALLCRVNRKIQLYLQLDPGSLREPSSSASPVL